MLQLMRRAARALYRQSPEHNLKRIAEMLRARGLWRAWRARLLKYFFTLPTIGIEAVSEVGRKFEPAIKDDICIPPYIGIRDHDDFDPLMKVLASSKPSLVLELGTGYGNTVANICHEFPDARVVTVNAEPDDISGVSITYALSREEIGRVYRQWSFSGRVVQIFCDTQRLDLSQYLQPSTVDVAVVDACHDAEYVMRDFLNVEPYVRGGGLVMLHDTDESMEGHLAGSYLACMRLRRRGYDIRHIENTWWAIWRKPPQDKAQRRGNRAELVQRARNSL